jgi:hypothetical protein
VLKWFIEQLNIQRYMLWVREDCMLYELWSKYLYSIKMRHP